MIAFLLSPIGKFVSALVLLIAIMAGFKLWLVNHDASVRSELVTLYEVKVAEAKAAETKLQSEKSAAAIKAANEKATAAKAAENAIKAHTELRISDYEKRLADEKRRCDLTDDDIDVMHHQ